MDRWDGESKPVSAMDHVILMRIALLDKMESGDLRDDLMAHLSRLERKLHDMEAGVSAFLGIREINEMEIARIGELEKKGFVPPKRHGQIEPDMEPRRFSQPHWPLT